MTQTLTKYAEIEKALIGRILIKPENIGEIDDLRPEDFAYPDWAKVFRCILKMHSEGKPFDVTLIEAETGVGIDLMALRPRSGGKISDYVETLKAAAARRRIMQAMESARYRLEYEAGDPLAIVEDSLGGTLRGESTATLKSSIEVALDYRRIYAERSLSRGLPFGLPKIDGILLPAKAGRLIMVASRPGIGKTAFAETVADEWAKYGPVLFVNLEMSSEELTDRALARMSGTSAREIIMGNKGISELEPYITQREDLPITYLDKGKASPGDIISAAMRTKMVYGSLAGVVIDYLQLVSHDRENEVYRVADISHAAKRLARDAGCPVLALAQTSRRIEYEDRPPKMSDLRDSGMLEADADAIVIITGNPDQPLREFHVLKQRQGNVGRVEVYFDADTQRWLDSRPDGEW
jgi:replicative DNA helicase